MAPDVDLTAPLPTGLTMIEASAGTGKTYTLVALALRSIVEDDLPMSSLCLVTFTEAATAEMRGRLRISLTRALEHLLSDNDRHDDPVIDFIGRDRAVRGLRASRLEQALAELDTAWITTIHGWCARVLATSGIWTGHRSTLVQHSDDVTEVVHDVLIARYASSGDLPAPVSKITDAVSARLAMPLARLQRLDPEPLGPKASPAQRSRWAAVVERVARSDEISQLIDDIVAEVHQRRRERGLQTFDSLLTDVRAILVDPDHVDLVRSLRERFSMVLIDEFQDTDQIQWDIFRTAFVEPLPGPITPQLRRVVLVGDPKQSIYRFRSAEVSAYLAARRHAGDGLYTLRTNRRSDPALLAGVEQLLAEVTFGHPDVTFESVAAPANLPYRRLQGVEGAALQIRVIDGVPPDAGSLRRAVRRDVTATALQLLDGSCTVDDVRQSGGQRTLRPGDIAVLTRSNSEATAIALDLSAAGVPAATAASSSVLDSQAGRQWRVLLTALAQPARHPSARAAATGWFVGTSLDDLVDDTSPTSRRDVIDLLSQWSRALTTGGVPALMAALGGSGWQQRVLGRLDGERHVTDVEHIAELLHTATAGRSVTAASLLAVLADLDAAAEQRVTAELLARRIDRDDDAVQVMTIHRAKGLEFPVVLCPGLWTGSPPRQGLAHGVVDGQRFIDITSMWKLTEAQRRMVVPVDLQQLDKDERLGEERRLMYVAITRARHRCIVWWAASEKGSSQLRTIVDAHGGPSALASRSAGTIDTVVVSPALTAPMAVTASSAPLDTAAACSLATRFHDRRWRIWSFSAITSAADDASFSPSGGGVDELGTDLVLPLDSDDPVDVVIDERRVNVVERHEALTVLQKAPGGTRFGTLVHRVLERCDFTRVDLSDHLAELCRGELEHSRLGITADQLARGLTDLLAVPLGGPADLGPLTELSRHDRLDELDFDLTTTSTDLRQLGQLLIRHLDVDDPAHPWAHQLAGGALDVSIDGRLTGSIDLMARTGPGHRVWIADYKTNRLPVGHGRDLEELHQLMNHSHYWLQAALYLVAAHRYLTWRLRNYDPDRHLIGAAYLFVRGMSGDHPGSGVLWWRPSTAAIDAMDRWLGGSMGS